MTLVALFRRNIKPTTSRRVSAATAPAAHVSTAAPAMDEAHQERSHAEIMVVITALMLAMLLAALDQTIVSTALPRIASDLHGLSKLSWVATAYLLTSAIVTPLYGKISDLFGRKKIFMVSIILFLIGSALCGLSQNMTQLIFFRALQGLGGGGIFTLALSIVGDVVPPRQRGRYQGYFGAVFGISSVAGPLLGGFFTDSSLLGWRWIFYINIPIGIIALMAIWTRLHLAVRRTEHKVDFLGAGLLGVAAVCLLLALVWGGTTYPWSSDTILGLFIGTILGGGLFLLRESRAAEPIIPLRLFKNDIFTISVILSMLSGLAMFGAIIFLPEYQQIVRGDSAIKSGLLLIPLVFGLLGASLVSGRLISKLGHYRPFPIIGTVLLTIGFWLFSHITLGTSQLMLSIWMIVLGAGVGMFMQVMTLAVQNSVERKDLGTATSVVVFSRSIGSSLGAAIFGAVLVARLNHHLAQSLPQQAAGTHLNASNLQASPAQLQALPPTVLHDILSAFASSFHDVFLFGIPFALLAFLVSLFLRETPLKSSTKDMAEGESLEAAH